MKRAKKVYVRVTEQEYAQMVTEAAETGLNVSEYLRNVLAAHRALKKAQREDSAQGMAQ